jgi:chromosome segregation ATPase
MSPRRTSRLAELEDCRARVLLLEDRLLERDREVERLREQVTQARHATELLRQVLQIERADRWGSG